MPSDVQMKMLRNIAQHRLTAAQPTEAQARQRAYAAEAVHEALKTLGSADTCLVLEAHLTGRSDVSARHLEDLGNRLQRLAWNMERGR